MGDLSRFGVSIDDELLQSFDQLIAKQGYANRSEALRDLIRDALVKSKVENTGEAGEVMGSLTLIYDHHAHELSDKMNDLQHKYFDMIVSVMHVHINHDDCMEVIIMRGEVKNVRSVANSLLSLKGVKHGKLFMTLPAAEIAGQKTTKHGDGHHH